MDKIGNKKYTEFLLKKGRHLGKGETSKKKELLKKKKKKKKKDK